MQQLEMVSHIDSTIRVLPKGVKMRLQRVMNELNDRLPHQCGGYDRKNCKKNCQIEGADVSRTPDVSQDVENQLKRFSSYSEFVHFRLPDHIMRLIYDRHREYVIIYLYKYYTFHITQK